jgi:hypothetical protein
MLASKQRKFELDVFDALCRTAAEAACAKDAAIENRTE